MTFFITTSWDDGHQLDLRLAEMLDKHGLIGTFYIAQTYVTPRLTDTELQALATRHEIGAHTLTHPSLAKVDLATAKTEIEGSKVWLEQLLGKPVTAFCYPRGEYTPAVKQLVKEVGFRMARTVEGYALNVGNDPFAVPTTIHVYPFPERPIQTKNPLRRYEPLRRVLPHVWSLRLTPFSLLRWERMAMRALERASTVGGVWHLWGHSWEIEQYGMWKRLDDVLRLARLYGAQPLTNSDLITHLPSNPVLSKN